MDVKAKFKAQNKNRIIYTILVLSFWIPVVIIKYYKVELVNPFLKTDIIVLILQFMGLIFAYFVYVNSKCPSCNKLAGNGWNIKDCIKCGQQLS